MVLRLRGGPPPEATVAPPPANAAPPQAVKQPTISQPQDDGCGAGGRDLMSLPALLDAQIGRLDASNAMRSTIIKPAKTWQRSRQASLLAKPADESLGSDALVSERHRAFDLLDALSRSGTLPFEHCQLHVIPATTYDFSSSLINAVVQGNINPLDCLDRALFITSSVLFQQDPLQLALPHRADRVRFLFPSHSP